MSQARAHSDPGSRVGGLHISALEARCRELMKEGLAQSTRRSYASAQNRFTAFCLQFGKAHADGSVCPADEWTLCLFASFLSQSLNHASIKAYLSAVRALHVEQGFPDPLLDRPRLQRVIRGIKRVHGTKATDRLPITDDIMWLIHGHLDMSQVDHLMFWAACCLAYFGFMRSAEFTVPKLSSYSSAIHLSVQDIAVDSIDAPSCLCVYIKASKTDPFRKGCRVYVGRATPPLCAVHSLLAYLKIRGDSPGPLILLQSGQPLTRPLLTNWLRKLLLLANIPGNYSSHSFRIGAATVAARNGVPDHLIQSMGRWSSNAYQRYIRSPVEVLASASARLSK
ncbi:uncharacterized protein LOC116306659 [Actinia tenebrosa]|uniref:Uncharacterized protein LOC116306659 n=1 Tax=Actinia tenebrosa TaxID=6105 RepID=A0A6P8J3K7_ACTTE|nr:uncharacterized protein LOC116306659 [Actinia tenebrosa]